MDKEEKKPKEKKIIIVTKGFLFCGHCGKTLSKTNKREMESGICTTCRKNYQPIPNQMSFLNEK